MNPSYSRSHLLYVTKRPVWAGESPETEGDSWHRFARVGETDLAHRVINDVRAQAKVPEPERPALSVDGPEVPSRVHADFGREARERRVPLPGLCCSSSGPPGIAAAFSARRRHADHTSVWAAAGCPLRVRFGVASRGGSCHSFVPATRIRTPRSAARLLATGSAADSAGSARGIDSAASAGSGFRSTCGYSAA